jgi:hypothetical protein
MITIGINITEQQNLALKRLQARSIEQYPEQRISLSAVLRMILDQYFEMVEDVQQ